MVSDKKTPVMTREEIDKIVVEYKINIGNYSISSEGLIDVDGDVKFGDKSNVKKMPLQFGKVTGDFDISYLDLVTLKGSPTHVDGYFDCGVNSLKSLKHGPKYVGGYYSCTNNRLKNLKHFDCSGFTILFLGMNHLKSLKGLPDEFNADLNCEQNRLDNLVGLPLKITGQFVFDDTVKSMYTGSTNHTCSDVQMIRVPRANLSRLPEIFCCYAQHMTLIFKYQYLFGVWPDEDTFDEKEFVLLIEEIEDGLL